MAFQQGLSGLNTSARALDVISNNISNAATVGFKGGQAQFANVYAAALGVGGGSQVGIGSSMAAVQQQFTQGNISNSTNALDLAINGSGFFRLQKSVDDGTVTYSRNGQYHLDSSGYVVNATSNHLTGYNIIDGVVDRARLVPVQLDTSGSPPQATGSSTSRPGVQIQMNFDDRDTKSLFSTGGDKLASWSENTVFPPNSLSTFNYSTSLTIYDQKGNAHALSMYFTRVDNSEGTTSINQSGDAVGKHLWMVHYVLDDVDITSCVRSTSSDTAGYVPVLEFDAAGKLVTGTPSTTKGINFSETFSVKAHENDATQSVFNVYDFSMKPDLNRTVVAPHTNIVVKVNGVTLAENADYTIDDQTGQITFSNATVSATVLAGSGSSISFDAGSPFVVEYQIGDQALATSSQFKIDTSLFVTAPVAPNALDTVKYPTAADYTNAMTAYNTEVAAFNALVFSERKLAPIFTPVSDPVAAPVAYKAEYTTYKANIDNYNKVAKFEGLFGDDTNGDPIGIPIDFAAKDPITLEATSSTMFGSGYDANKITQDGYPYGRLSGVAVTSDGVLRGNYSNGQTKDIAQLVLADFISPVGLMNLGNNQWQETAASGQALIGDPGTGSRGLLQSSAVEDANIDLTQELVNLITFQRNYQANAQSIKTQDTVMQPIVNLR